VVEAMADAVPGLALLGSGVFASTQYVPKLGELGELISLKTIWSRSEVDLLLISIDSCQCRIHYRVFTSSTDSNLIHVWMSGCCKEGSAVGQIVCAQC
jgi:hypothetical protein